jgi:integrase
LGSDATKRAGSVARDRSILTIHVLPVFGKKEIGAVTKADVQRLVNSWTATPAPSSVGRMYSCLRAMFSYAESSKLILPSPCRDIRLPQSPPRQAQILDGDDLEVLAAAMGINRPMVYLAVLGLRWGEIAGLRVGRLDFLRHTLTVAAQRTRGEKGRMVDADPRTKASRRTLAVPEPIMTMLSAHLAARGLTASDPDPMLFTSLSGEPLHYSNWRRRVWVPATQKAGFRGLHFHDLKHTAGTALVSQGVDVKTAQVRLGHANVSTTLGIYAQATERADRKAAQSLSEYFGPRSGRGVVSDSVNYPD